MICHFVLFEPKPGIDRAERLAFVRLVKETAASIASVQRVTVGRRADIDPGYQRNLGDETYSYAAMLEFADKAGLIAYLNDPRHSLLGELFWRLCERALVFETSWADLDNEDELDEFVR